MSISGVMHALEDSSGVDVRVSTAGDTVVGADFLLGRDSIVISVRVLSEDILGVVAGGSCVGHGSGHDGWCGHEGWCGVSVSYDSGSGVGHHRGGVRDGCWSVSVDGGSGYGDSMSDEGSSGCRHVSKSEDSALTTVDEGKGVGVDEGVGHGVSQGVGEGCYGVRDSGNGSGGGSDGVGDGITGGGGRDDAIGSYQRGVGGDGRRHGGLGYGVGGDDGRGMSDGGHGSGNDGVGNGCGVNRVGNWGGDDGGCVNDGGVDGGCGDAGSYGQVGGGDPESVGGIRDVFGALDESVSVDVRVSSAGDAIKAASLVLSGKGSGVSIRVLSQNILSVVLAGCRGSHYVSGCGQNAQSVDRASASGGQEEGERQHALHV